MSDKPKVVSLRGIPIPDPTEPDADVVEAAEYLLERAKAGEVKGLVYVAVDNGGQSARRLMIGECISPAVLGLMTMLKTELMVQMFEDDD